MPWPDDAVGEAVASGTYTDRKGCVYKKGMDGWFSDIGMVQGEDGNWRPTVHVTYHHDMIAFIRKEEAEGYLS